MMLDHWGLQVYHRAVSQQDLRLDFNTEPCFKDLFMLQSYVDKTIKKKNKKYYKLIGKREGHSKGQ